MYSEGAPEDDMRERIEEMERMREHVFGEVDQNKDGLISFAEFIDQTKKQEFQKDEGWDSLDQHKQFTEEEYRQFEKRRLEEIERLVAQGMVRKEFVFVMIVAKIFFVCIVLLLIHSAHFFFFTVCFTF